MTVATSLSASTRPICLLVADNNRMSSQLLADALKRDHRIARVCPTASFPEALATATTEMASVALVSCEMDRGCQKGFALARELRKIRHGLQIVMLLESSCRDSVIGAFRAGASGVFCRTSSIALLTKCILAVHAGQIWANSRELEYMVSALAESTPARAFNPRAAALLSRREQEVVRCVGAGLTNRKIAERLGLSDHTVKNYLFRIFEKLGVSSRLELVLHALTQDPGPDGSGVADTASAELPISGRRSRPKPPSPLPRPASAWIANGTED